MPANFKKNTLSIGFNNILISLFGFVSAVLIARALGPQKQGLVGVVLVTVDILIKLIGFGAQTAASYFINSREFERRRIINNALSFSLAMGLVTGIVVAITFRPTVSFNSNASFALIAGLFTGAYLAINFFRINIIGVFYALEKFNISNRLNLANVVIPVFIVVPLFFLKILDIRELFAIYLFSSFVQVVWGLLLLERTGNKFSFSLDWNMIRHFFKYGSQAYLNSITQFLQQRLGIYFIQRFLGYGSAGHFTISYNVADRLSDISNPLVITHFPRSTQLKNISREEAAAFTQKSFSRLLACYIFISPFSTVAIYFLLPIIFSRAYEPSVYPAIVLSFAIMLTGLSRLLNNLYASINLQKPNSFILVSALIFNAMIFYPALRLIDIAGVAWSMIISLLIVLTAQIIFLKFKLGLPFKPYPDFKGFLKSIRELKNEK